MTKMRVWLSAVVFLMALAGAAGAAQECPKGMEPVTEFRLFFGLTDKDDKAISEDQWQRFLAGEITPRFPAGLTVFDANGQWLPPSGKLQREPVKVVLVAVSEDPAQSIKRVHEISAEYAKRFNQYAVFLIAGSSCAGTHPPVLQ